MSYKNPKVSIIIPFYNRISLVKRALCSVLKQSFTDYEVILINDGSIQNIDEIVFLVNESKKIKIIELPKNCGVSFARNVGIKKANGKYVAFLDSDDEWFEDKLFKQIEYMESSNHFFTHTSYTLFNQETSSSKTIYSGSINYKYPYMAFHCRIATPTVIIKREILNGFWFDEKTHFGEDIILWTNLAKKYGPLKGINYALTKVNIRSNSAAKNPNAQKIAFEAIRNNCLNESRLMKLLHKIYISLRY